MMTDDQPVHTITNQHPILVRTSNHRGCAVQNEKDLARFGGGRAVGGATEQEWL